MAVDPYDQFDAEIPKLASLNAMAPRPVDPYDQFDAESPAAAASARARAGIQSAIQSGAIRPSQAQQFNRPSADQLLQKCGTDIKNAAIGVGTGFPGAIGNL